uniref:DNA-processing protein DprA n=1 Tax=Litorivivens sp. TaxID=2020868 RepID=UPI003568106B
SHRGALTAKGATIAVLGSGIDVVYPRRNQALYDQILAEGLLVSEFAPGTPPRREQFPQRNRVISGLSLGVLVVEAAVRSGSLITARYALEQGREVFAIPGSIHNPLARGCHQLIRQGAALVESAQDILDAWVGWLPPALEEMQTVSAGPPVVAPGQQRLLQALGYDPLPLDKLAEQCRLAVDELLPELLTLELEGWVEQQGACWVRCR